MRWLSLTLLWTLRGYQKMISKFTPNVCRFEPTCSHYAVESIRTHGALRGVWLSGSRVLRCNPLHSGGFDPVPGMKRGETNEQ